MHRIEFIRKLGLGGLAVCAIPDLLVAQQEVDYTLAQLTGRGNPDLTGTSYRSIMHRAAREAFDKMKEKAASEGVILEVVSAYRSFERQKAIFENKYRRFLSQGLRPEAAIERIIEYSTIPGTSRHHWGTDLDLIDASPRRPENVLNAKNFHGSGPFVNMRKWMEHNAEQFGFYLVYTDRKDRKGFKYEPWHYSYAPVAIPMLHAFCKLDIKEVLDQEKVLGSDHFNEAFMERYKNEQILDINKQLL